MKKKLTEGKESAYMSQTLARICREVPLGITLDDVRTTPMDKARARELFIRYEFSGFIKRFGITEEAATPVKPAELTLFDVVDELPWNDAPVMDAPAAPVEESTAAITSADLATLPRGRYAVAYEDGVLSFTVGEKWRSMYYLIQPN